MQPYSRCVDRPAFIDSSDGVVNVKPISRQRPHSFMFADSSSRTSDPLYVFIFLRDGLAALRFLELVRSSSFREREAGFSRRVGENDPGTFAKCNGVKDGQTEGSATGILVRRARGVSYVVHRHSRGGG